MNRIIVSVIRSSLLFLSVTALVTGAWGLGADKPAAVVEAGMVDFAPRTVTIRVGQSVLWRNPSQLVHSVTADPAKAEKKSNVRLPKGAQPFDSGELQPGATFSHTFTVAGTYQYICVPHEAVGMIGTVVVR